jgi:uncharacterized secreted protein with C-terminal beta-propeller domain
MSNRTVYVALALVLVLCTGCPLFPQTGDYRFTSADLGTGRWNGRMPGLYDAVDAPAEGEAEETREVIEPDVIRQDGHLLYILNQYRGLLLVDLEDEVILWRIPTYGYPRDLYIRDGRAYVLVGNATEYTTEGNTVSFKVKTRLYVIDTENIDGPAIVGSFDLEGDLVDSRLVGDVLYAVTADYQWYWVETDVVRKEAASSHVLSVNIADPGHIYEADKLEFPGAGTVIQATNSAIYVASNQWDEDWHDDTRITYVDISDPAGQMEVRGSVLVAGQVADRFKIDAFEGVLRVVSSAWEWSDEGSDRMIYITTVDLADPDDLAVMAQSEFVSARGDTLFATRFDGPRAYVVTFFIVDPLYVLDLSDPYNPQVTAELEVPGWSTHIEPRGDRLIALGVDDTQGRRVSVSLFDVADPTAPALVERVSFGDDWSWSSAYEDVKAFNVLDNLILVPFSGWNETIGGYDRLQFISYGPANLDVRGYVDLDGDILRSLASGEDYYGVTSEQLARIDATDLDTPFVANRLTLAENVADFVELSSNVGVEVISRYDTGTTLIQTESLPLKSLGALEIDMPYTYDVLGYDESVVLVGEQAIAMESPWEYRSQYRVVVVDCSDPAAPSVASDTTLDFQPYYGYGPWRYVDYEPIRDDALPGDAVGGSPGTKIALAPWWIPWRPQSDAFLLGHTLVLRGTADSYSQTVGPDEAEQGVALIDLSNEDLPYATLGLGFADIVSVDAAGGALYVGTSENAGMEGTSLGPVVAYFLTEVDVNTPAAGPSVNVPGLFLQYDPEKQLLTLRDEQWWGFPEIVRTVADDEEPYWGYTTALKTVSWDGENEVVPLDSAMLPGGAGQVLARGARVYFDAYDSGYKLHAASIADNGAIALGDGVLVTEQSGSLVDAQGLSAYVAIGNGAVARYDFATGNGTLTDLVPVMGWPSRVRFGQDTAYILLGYFGIVTLPL